jgi:RimJ/RimL family protein N-acetyltransferase
MRLETDRLLLRALRPEDIEPEVALWSDSQVMRFMGGSRNDDRVRTMLQEELAEPPLGPFGQWPVVEKASSEFVGDCGLIAKEIEGRDEVELVYVLASSAWGSGYATEIGAALLRFAEEDLHLKRVVSLIDVDNVASKRVSEKLGMHREAMVKRPDGVERELWVWGPWASWLLGRSRVKGRKHATWHRS